MWKTLLPQSFMQVKIVMSHGYAHDQCPTVAFLREGLADFKASSLSKPEESFAIVKVKSSFTSREIKAHIILQDVCFSLA